MAAESIGSSKNLKVGRNTKNLTFACMNGAKVLLKEVGLGYAMKVKDCN